MISPVHFVSTPTAQDFGDIFTDENASLRRLRATIEDMAQGRFDSSFHAYNIFNIPHTTVVNGHVRLEGEPSAPWTSLSDVHRATYGVARDMRVKISGPVCLFWRVLPEIETFNGKSRFYTRFSFAPWSETLCRFGDA